MMPGPYETKGTASGIFDLPGPTAGVGRWDEIVAPPRPLTGTIQRYIQEVKLLQDAIGAKPDGIIGPETRTKAREAWERRQKP